MRKNKDKDKLSINKHRPFNIKIELNIHPKHITHHHQTSFVKVSSKPHHNRFNPQTNKIKCKKQYLQIQEAEINHSNRNSKEIVKFIRSQKNIQNLRKQFYGKISNIIFDLPSPQLDKDENINLQQAICAKINQKRDQLHQRTYEQNQKQLHLVKDKHKVLQNTKISRILKAQNQKADQMKCHKIKTKKIANASLEEKQINNLSKKIGSKITFPERNKSKSFQKNKLIFKNQKPKLTNQKMKLQKFKIDMVKLVKLYQQGQIFKSEITQIYQIQKSLDLKQSKELNKSVQDHQLSKIKQLFTNNFSGKKKYNEISQFKQISQLFSNKQQQEEITRKDQQSTQHIAQQYNQISDDKIDTTPSKKVTHSNQLLSSSLKPQQKLQNLHTLQNNDYFKFANQSDKLEKFIAFLFQKMPNSRQIELLKAEMNKIVIEFIDKNQNQSHQTFQQIKPNQNENISMMYSSVDDFLNRQITNISFLQNQISPLNLDDNQIDSIAIWEQHYKQELLKVKDKMWKQYRIIKDQIQNRICNNKHQTIQTMKSKRRKRIMKCLSQRIISYNSLKYFRSQTDLESQFIKLKIQKQQHSIQQKQSRINRTPASTLTSNLDQLQTQFLVCSKQYQALMALQENNPINPQTIIPEQKVQLSPFKIEELTDSDKQDVFEFIFLDLCIEFYQDVVNGEKFYNNNPNNDQIQPSQKIINLIRKYIQNQKNKNKNILQKRIGISTNYITIAKHLTQIIQFLLSGININNSILTNPQSIIVKLNTPIGPTQSQILKSLRLSKNQSQTHYKQNIAEEQNEMNVLSSRLFYYFQNQVIKVKQLKFNKYYQSQERQIQRVNFLRSCTHFHNKAIFDGLNERLDDQRIYGLYGKPFVWKKCSNLNQKRHENQLKQIMTVAASEVMKCTTFSCGLMINKQQSLIQDLSSQPQYVAQLQDERIVKLLQNYICQIEKRWFFHDDEEAEVLIQLSYFAQVYLIKEFIREITRFRH